jgi:hypothetical protein
VRRESYAEFYRTKFWTALAAPQQLHVSRALEIWRDA